MGFPCNCFDFIFFALSGTSANGLESFQCIKMMSTQRTIKITKKGLEDKIIY